MSTAAPNGAERTADEVLQGLDLGAVTALVTGATGGLGLETARALAAQGASVTLAGRGESRLQQAVQGIVASTGNERLDWLEIDLGSMASVRTAARRFCATHERLNLLINNAGVMASPLAYSVDGREMQFAVCHLGHFLLTVLLVPMLVRSAPSRVVNLSSAGHKRSDVHFDDVDFRHRPYEKWQAYGQAKTANILFSVALNRRLSGLGVSVNAVHPGAIASTDLGRHLQREDYEQLRAWAGSAGGYSFKTLEQGAATTVWAATDPALGSRGGLYLEDCGVAKVNDDPATTAGGYRSYARDPEAAEQLWAMSEKLVGESFAWEVDA